MSELYEELETLRELNAFRIRARELREQGLRPLRQIKNIENHEITPIDNAAIDFNDWFVSGNHVEASLLIKIQNHRDISNNEKINNKAKSDESLRKQLDIDIKLLFQKINDGKIDVTENQPTVPVLMAARIMQALLSRSKTVFSKTTMFCYYRIVRELYLAGNPDWTFGAARAGKDCSTSAFVTGECIRAIFALQNSITATIGFLENIHRLYERYESLTIMIDALGNAGKDADHPLRRFADHAIERMWLDCYLSTNPRNQQIVLYCGNGDNDLNLLLLPEEKDEIKMETVKRYFHDFESKLNSSVKNIRKELESAQEEVDRYRESEKPVTSKSKIVKMSVKNQLINMEKISIYDRTASAHLAANRVINNMLEENDYTLEIFDNDSGNLKNILENLVEQGNSIAGEIRKLLDPINQYIKTVIRRELAASPSMFDAGELVFAATAFGAMNEWKPNELLTRACQLLVEAVPESGRLVTKRPLHSTQRGYRLLPIGCEMMRSLAQLFQKTNFEVEPKLVGRMLNIFEEKLIRINTGNKKKQMIAWNYEGAPRPKKPCLWVSAVAVLALDRIVRMLNTRINNSILKHFDVIKPDKPHLDLTLNDLIYTDYGFSEYYFKTNEKLYGTQLSIPLRLEQMRAHLMRVTLPKNERYEKSIFSTIFYGPPGTGKTTLAEALALSAQVPVLNLSPGDLLVKGQELMEGRARDVFEALSMLTQAVIILDEFEPVLKSRAEDDDSHLNTEEKKIEALKAIGKKEDTEFKFLLAGMLPKLLKLHDTAEHHSLVYCLATNYIKDIDDAAKRRGRFDTKMPVYNPCPLSRAGTFLLRLVQVEKSVGNKFVFAADAERIKRFMKVIEITAFEPASELSGKYFKVKPDEDNEYLIRPKSEYFDYVLKGDKVNLDSEREDAEKKLEKEKKVETYEKDERDWLIKFEKQFEANEDLAKALAEPK